MCVCVQDFGEYQESYYSVQTTEGEQISQLIAGYIDIILKKVRSLQPHNEMTSSSARLWPCAHVRGYFPKHRFSMQFGLRAFGKLCPGWRFFFRKVHLAVMCNRGQMENRLKVALRLFKKKITHLCVDKAKVSCHRVTALWRYSW